MHSKTRTDSPLQQAIHPSCPSSSDTTADWLPVNLDLTPGGPGWSFYSQPVSETLAKGLAYKWPAIEQTFIKTLRYVFQGLRKEREAICQYFFVRRSVSQSCSAS